MTKAHIVLSAIVLFAIAGGSLAFKAIRTGFPVIITTTAVNAFGTIYTLAGAATFYYTSPTRFFTVAPDGQITNGSWTITAAPVLVLILTRVGGTQTITIPNYGTVTALTTTRVTSAD